MKFTRKTQVLIVIAALAIAVVSFLSVQRARGQQPAGAPSPNPPPRDQFIISTLPGPTILVECRTKRVSMHAGQDGETIIQFDARPRQDP